MGEDFFGKEYKEDLIKNKIDVSYVGIISKVVIGVVFIFVNDSGKWLRLFVWLKKKSFVLSRLFFILFNFLVGGSREL